jgi:hypothetical protein
MKLSIQATHHLINKSYSMEEQKKMESGNLVKK